jgi:hypothetical protein
VKIHCQEVQLRQAEQHADKMKKNNFVFYFIGIVAVAAVAFLLWNNNNKPAQYDQLAQCLADSGAKMYGAWWCPHCNNQKEAFGKSWKIFSDAGGYVECSTADRQQTEICQQTGITGYPTWRFPDGSELSGEVNFYLLAQHSNCTAALTQAQNQSLFFLHQLTL